MIIDLCCGLGRFESPNEEIISIDMDRRVKPTIAGDVRYLPLRPNLRPRLVHASPPCRYLSNARWCTGAGTDERGIAATLRIVAACFDAFDYLDAKNWTLENPVGMLRKIMPTNIEIRYKTKYVKEKRTNFWTNVKGLKRAIIPQDIRQKILSVANE